MACTKRQATRKASPQNAIRPREINSSPTFLLTAQEFSVITNKMLAAIQLFVVVASAQHLSTPSAIDSFTSPLAHFILGITLSALITQATLILSYKLLPPDHEYLPKWGASKEAAYHLKVHIAMANACVYWVYSISAIGQCLAGFWLLGESSGVAAWRVAVWGNAASFVDYCFAILAPAALWWACAVRPVGAGEGVREGESDEETQDYELVGREEKSADDSGVRRRIVPQTQEVGSEDVEEWEMVTGFFQ
ncbi:hypothetical protein CERZMDRAFT_97796 [Cercospora zeae-maydis SCOH1-5]|uniref:Uncharacterized protein n=1 Tax=Cercospora zeae-maydis SCOH1-5 TaxID=717836 RepID=A0A6A6FER8_9PEZI|nr:hypothetical protein CERZMDRAFT_97796 [Cercospora zeae-maydis SCOH1-5]